MTSPPEFDDAHERLADTDAPGRRGEAVDPSVRRKVHRSLGQDAGDVRIHTGRAAQAEAARREARALTRKKDIYFARDEYRPGTKEGKRLLIHELAHTIQQSGDGGEGAGRDLLEAEADQAAGAVARGRQGRVSLKAPPGAVQLQEKGKAAIPSIQRHPDEILPTPSQGTISGAGMTVAYLYSSSPGASFLALVLQVPEGIALVATPLTNLREGTDYRIQNAGGTKARAVVISMSLKVAVPPKLQVTFTRGSTGYVVTFQFPASAERK